MQLRARLDTSGPRRLLADIARASRDVKPALRRILGAARALAKKRFKGLVSPPLSRSYLLKLQQTRTSAVTAAGNVRASYARNLEAQLRKKAGGELTIAELRRLARGGSAAFSLSEQQDRSIERLRKQLERARRTKKRVGGDRRRSDKHELLGRLKTALQGSVKGMKAILENRVPWSGVHNEGGAVGHRARVPARPTLYILAEDLRTYAQITLDSVLGRRR